MRKSQEIACSTRLSLHLCAGHSMCVEANESDVSKGGPKATPTTQAYLTMLASHGLHHQAKCLLYKALKDCRPFKVHEPKNLACSTSFVCLVHQATQCLHHFDDIIMMTSLDDITLLTSSCLPHAHIIFSKNYTLAPKDKIFTL